MIDPNEAFWEAVTVVSILLLILMLAACRLGNGGFGGRGGPPGKDSNGKDSKSNKPSKNDRDRNKRDGDDDDDGRDRNKGNPIEPKDGPLGPAGKDADEPEKKDKKDGQPVESKDGPLGPAGDHPKDDKKDDDKKDDKKDKRRRRKREDRRIIDDPHFGRTILHGDFDNRDFTVTKENVDTSDSSAPPSSVFGGGGGGGGGGGPGPGGGGTGIVRNLPPSGGNTPQTPFGSAGPNGGFGGGTGGGQLPWFTGAGTTPLPGTGLPGTPVINGGGGGGGGGGMAGQPLQNGFTNNTLPHSGQNEFFRNSGIRLPNGQLLSPSGFNQPTVNRVLIPEPNIDPVSLGVSLSPKPGQINYRTMKNGSLTPGFMDFGGWPSEKPVHSVVTPPWNEAWSPVAKTLHLKPEPYRLPPTPPIERRIVMPEVDPAQIRLPDSPAYSFPDVSKPSEYQNPNLLRRQQAPAPLNLQHTSIPREPYKNYVETIKVKPTVIDQRGRDGQRIEQDVNGSVDRPSDWVAPGLDRREKGKGIRVNYGKPGDDTPANATVRGKDYDGGGDGVPNDREIYKKKRESRILVSPIVERHVENVGPKTRATKEKLKFEDRGNDHDPPAVRSPKKAKAKVRMEEPVEEPLSPVVKASAAAKLREQLQAERKNARADAERVIELEDVLNEKDDKKKKNKNKVRVVDADPADAKVKIKKPKRVVVDEEEEEASDDMKDLMKAKKKKKRPRTAEEKEARAVMKAKRKAKRAALEVDSDATSEDVLDDLKAASKAKKKTKRKIKQPIEIDEDLDDDVSVSQGGRAMRDTSSKPARARRAAVGVNDDDDYPVDDPVGMTQTLNARRQARLQANPAMARQQYGQLYGQAVPQHGQNGLQYDPMDPYNAQMSKQYGGMGQTGRQYLQPGGNYGQPGGSMFDPYYANQRAQRQGQLYDQGSDFGVQGQGQRLDWLNRRAKNRDTNGNPEVNDSYQPVGNDGQGHDTTQATHHLTDMAGKGGSAVKGGLNAAHKPDIHLSNPLHGLTTEKAPVEAEQEKTLSPVTVRNDQDLQARLLEKDAREHGALGQGVGEAGSVAPKQKVGEELSDSGDDLPGGTRSRSGQADGFRGDPSGRNYNERKPLSPLSRRNEIPPDDELFSSSSSIDYSRGSPGDSDYDSLESELELDDVGDNYRSGRSDIPLDYGSKMTSVEAAASVPVATHVRPHPTNDNVGAVAPLSPGEKLETKLDATSQEKAASPVVRPTGPPETSSVPDLGAQMIQDIPSDNKPAPKPAKSAASPRHEVLVGEAAPIPNPPQREPTTFLGSESEAESDHSGPTNEERVPRSVDTQPHQASQSHQAERVALEQSEAPPIPTDPLQSPATPIAPTVNDKQNDYDILRDSGYRPASQLGVISDGEESAKLTKEGYDILRDSSYRPESQILAGAESEQTSNLNPEDGTRQQGRPTSLEPSRDPAGDAEETRNDRPLEPVQSNLDPSVENPSEEVTQGRDTSGNKRLSDASTLQGSPITEQFEQPIGDAEAAQELKRSDEVDKFGEIKQQRLVDEVLDMLPGRDPKNLAADRTNATLQNQTQPITVGRVEVPEVDVTKLGMHHNTRGGDGVRRKPKSRMDQLKRGVELAGQGVDLANEAKGLYDEHRSGKGRDRYRHEKRAETTWQNGSSDKQKDLASGSGYEGTRGTSKTSPQSRTTSATPFADMSVLNPLSLARMTYKAATRAPVYSFLTTAAALAYVEGGRQIAAMAFILTSGAALTRRGTTPADIAATESGMSDLLGGNKSATSMEIFILLNIWFFAGTFLVGLLFHLTVSSAQDGKPRSWGGGLRNPLGGLGPWYKSFTSKVTWWTVLRVMLVSFQTALAILLIRQTTSVLYMYSTGGESPPDDLPDLSITASTLAEAANTMTSFVAFMILNFVVGILVLLEGWTWYRLLNPTSMGKPNLGGITSVFSSCSSGNSRILQVLQPIGIVLVTATFVGSLIWFEQISSYVDGMSFAANSGLNIPWILANVFMFLWIPAMGYVFVKVGQWAGTAWKYAGCGR